MKTCSCGSPFPFHLAELGLTSHTCLCGATYAIRQDFGDEERKFVPTGFDAKWAAMNDPKCCHCGRVCREAYMLHNHVWAEAVPDYEDRVNPVLHIKCLEARLGRPMSAKDLAPNSINDALRYILER